MLQSIRRVENPKLSSVELDAIGGDTLSMWFGKGTGLKTNRAAMRTCGQR